MQREELDQVRRLYRLFLAYERVEACAERFPAGERAVIVPALADLSRLCWRQVFGAALDAPAHRRFVLDWCLRNVELLMKEEVLPVIAHQVVAHHIQGELAGLSDDAHDFSQDGPQGPSGTALRRVYLIQSLTTLLARLALEGQIPARLQAHLMRHLMKRVRSLFAASLGDEGLDAAALPDLGAMLCGFRDAGVLAEDVAVRVHRADAAAAAALGAQAGGPPSPGAASLAGAGTAGAGTAGAGTAGAGTAGAGTAGATAALGSGSRPGLRVPMSGSGSGVNASGAIPRPVLGAQASTGFSRPDVGLASTPGLARPEKPDASEELVGLAAAGELMRRLRRQGSLTPEERDRLIKRVETEMDDLLETLGMRRLDRALAALGERLGIPVPPPRATGDPLTASGTIRLPAPAPEASAARLLPTARPPERTADSSDYQWAFDLIDDLRRESAEPEK